MAETDKKDAAKAGSILKLGQEIRSLIDDVKEWIELRIELFQLDVEDRVQAVANDILLILLIITLFGVAMLFLAFAAAFAVGEWLGSIALGFLIVGVVLAIFAVSIRSSRVDLAAKVGQTLTRAGGPEPPDTKVLPEGGDQK